MLTSKIIHNNGEQWMWAIVLLILSELWFLALMAPLLIIKSQTWSIQNKEIKTQLTIEDYYIEIWITSFSVLIRWFCSFLKIYHSYNWVLISKTWSENNPNCENKRIIKFIKSPIIFSKSNLLKWDSCLICYLDYNEVSHICSLDWCHSFCLK